MGARKHSSAYQVLAARTLLCFRGHAESHHSSKNSVVLHVARESPQQQLKNSVVLHVARKSSEHKNSVVLPWPGSHQSSKNSVVLEWPGSHQNSKNSVVLPRPESHQSSKNSVVLPWPGSDQSSKNSVLPRIPSHQSSKNSVLPSYPESPELQELCAAPVARVTRPARTLCCPRGPRDCCQICCAGRNGCVPQSAFFGLQCVHFLTRSRTPARPGGSRLIDTECSFRQG